MALAMVQFSYKSETVGNLLKNPEDRSKAVKKLIEKLGGKLISYYFAFGDYDGVVIGDFPDNTALLATSMVSYAGGGTTKLKTTVLLSVEEAMAAMKKGAGLMLEQPKG
jgi:uncharacterized protein with GYD domain